MQKKKRGVTRRRPIDEIADKSSWFMKTYRYVKKSRVASWKVAIILMFVLGLGVAVIASKKYNIHIFSDAANPVAVLSFNPASKTVQVGEIFTVDIMMDTKGANIVAATARVKYNKANFDLTGWDTTTSVFAANNSCIVNNKPCEIIEDNRANGALGITLGKPTPGVNTASGKIATLTFKALAATAVNTRDIGLSFVTVGDVTDSDVILDDGLGSDVLLSVSPFTVTVPVPPAPLCTAYTYGAWGTCANGMQTRTVTSSTPAGCSGGLAPVLTQACDVVTPKCTSYTYNAWGTCINGTQTRTVLSSTPAGCSGGTVPVLSRTCKVKGGGRK